jgi:hypothetical protein
VSGLGGQVKPAKKWHKVAAFQAGDKIASVATGATDQAPLRQQAGAPEIPSFPHANRISILRNGAFWRFLALLRGASSSISNLLKSLWKSTPEIGPSRERHLKMVRGRQPRRLIKDAWHGIDGAARKRGCGENVQRRWQGCPVCSKGGFYSRHRSVVCEPWSLVDLRGRSTYCAEWHDHRQGAIAIFSIVAAGETV